MRLRFIHELICLLVISVAGICPALDREEPTAPPPGTHVVLGWNDLGMHCMNPSFDSFCVLPPFNTLMAQAVLRGDRPQITSAGLSLSYRFPANTSSASKVNFWVYAHSLFGVDLPVDVGLAGFGLNGSMVWNNATFIAQGIPLTPFEDASPTILQPFQLAELQLRDSASSAILDMSSVVAPISTELRCDLCHSNGIRSVEDNILAQHDAEEDTNLLGSKPVLCASCHQSAALGTPGQPDVEPLSMAVHKHHAMEVPDIACYACHPGPKTRCLRGAMFLHGKTCTDCHGDITEVAMSQDAGRRAWADEPKCGSCHGLPYSENTGKLYRNSTGHGGMYCAACHNSPHAELPSAQWRDGLQAMRVQKSSSFIRDCTVCHTSVPTLPGPHGITAAVDLRVSLLSEPNPIDPGATFSYSIGIVNRGSLAATGVRVSMPIPPGLSYQSSTTSRGDCGVVSNTITWTLTKLEAGGSESAEVRMLSSGAGTALATVVATSDAMDRNTDDNVASETTYIGQAPVADLGITQSDSSDFPETGVTLDYRLEVTNHGPEAAQHVRVVDTLSTSVLFVGAIPTVGTCSVADNMVTCDLGTMAAGTTAGVVIRVVPHASGIAVNEAIVDGACIDSHPANNTSLHSSNVRAGYGADVSTVLTTIPEEYAVVGAPLTYQFDIHNNGPESAPSLKLTSDLPDGVDLARIVVARPGKSTVSGNQVTCDLGTLATGQSQRVQLIVVPTTTGTLYCRAEALADASDCFKENNSTSCTVEVGSPGALPDLCGSWSSMTWNQRGGSTNARYSMAGVLQVQNMGRQNAGRSMTRLYLSGDDQLDPNDVLLKQWRLPPTKGLSARTMRVNAQIRDGSLPGKFIIVVLNADGAVPESDTSNNVAVFGPVH